MNLAANFLPVRFCAHSFTASVLAFGSAEQLASLRKDLAGSHVVRRDGDRIVCVPIAADAAEVGEQKNFEIGEHRSLTMRLAREALIREVIAMKYKLCAFTRPIFVSRYPQHDLLALSAGAMREALRPLHVYPEYRLDTRSSGPSSQLGIIVRLKTRNEINSTVEELLRRGLAVEGRYVLADTGEVPFNPDLDKHVYRRLIGAVDSVRDGQLYLGMLPASLRWLRPRPGWKAVGTTSRTLSPF